MPESCDIFDIILHILCVSTREQTQRGQETSQDHRGRSNDETRILIHYVMTHWSRPKHCLTPECHLGRPILSLTLCMVLSLGVWPLFAHVHTSHSAW